MTPESEHNPNLYESDEVVSFEEVERDEYTAGLILACSLLCGGCTVNAPLFKKDEDFYHRQHRRDGSFVTYKCPASGILIFDNPSKCRLTEKEKRDRLTNEDYMVFLDEEKM